MKTLLIAVLATLLTGCASFDGQKFAQDVGNGLQYQATRQQQQPYQPYAYQPKLTDHVCVQNCTKAGMQYGYCTSKCSY